MLMKNRIQESHQLLAYQNTIWERADKSAVQGCAIHKIWNGIALLWIAAGLFWDKGDEES